MKKIFSLFFAVLCSLAGYADDSGISVCSYVSYSSENWTYPNDLGIYSFGSDGTRSTVAATEEFSNNDPTSYCSTGGVYIDGH